MPTVKIPNAGPYSFYFWTNENKEPAHVHIDRDNLECKFWLLPDVRLADNNGFPQHELNKIEKLVKQHVELILARWKEIDDRKKS
jgi:Domain of unknown function (DUF4160)